MKNSFHIYDQKQFEKVHLIIKVDDAEDTKLSKRI